MKKIDIISIFPNIFESYFSESIIQRAISKNLISINVVDLRKYSDNPYKSVDDKPFGGGAGMILKIEPFDKAINDLKTDKSHVIAMTAGGEKFVQSTAKRLVQKDHLIIICGRYEGLDNRILDFLVDESISIGNFVLTGGELPAMIVTDAITRLLPGSLGNEESAITDSFYDDDISVQHPIYTRPAVYNSIDGRVMSVPEILLSGNHKKIEEWKKNNVS